LNGQLRLLQPPDASEVAALWHAGAKESASVDPSFFPRVSLEEYAAFLANDFSQGSCIGWGVFAKEPQCLLAYLTARVMVPDPEFKQTRFLYLLDLDVHREARRHGLGARLVAAAKAYARTENLASIEVSWLTSDPRASAFWQKQGFRQFLARARSDTTPDPG